MVTRVTNNPSPPADTTPSAGTTRKETNPINPPTSPRNQPSRSPAYLQWLGWAVAAVIVFFAYLNIAPYEAAIRILLTPDQPSGLSIFVLNLPVIGAMARGGQNLLFWLVGAVLWAVLQTFELLPLLLFASRRALRGVLQQGQNSETFVIGENDDPALASIKKAYNRLPYQIVRQFRNAALGAYTVDLLICLRVYPPVENAAQAFMILSTGAWQLVDWGNVGLLLITLFAVEILVSLALMVKNLREILSGGAAHV